MQGVSLGPLRACERHLWVAKHIWLECASLPASIEPNSAAMEAPLSAQDVPSVLSCLASALSQSPDVQKQAESALASLEHRPGFCSCLAVGSHSYSSSSSATTTTGGGSSCCMRAHPQACMCVCV